MRRGLAIEDFGGLGADKVIHLLLGETSLDSRLAPFCQFYEPADARGGLPLAEKTWLPLKNLAKKAWFSRQPLWLSRVLVRSMMKPTPRYRQLI